MAIDEEDLKSKLNVNQPKPYSYVARLNDDDVNVSCDLRGPTDILRDVNNKVIKSEKNIEDVQCQLRDLSNQILELNDSIINLIEIVRGAFNIINNKDEPLSYGILQQYKNRKDDDKSCGDSVSYIMEKYGETKEQAEKIVSICSHSLDDEDRYC